MDEGRDLTAEAADRRPTAGDAAKDLFDEYSGLNALRSLPALLGGMAVALPVFIAVAIVLALPLWLALQVLGTSGPVAAVLPLAWFGGSLLVTALALRVVLRRFNAFLRRHGRPPLP